MRRDKAPSSAESLAPIDISRLNDFATGYNAYVEEIRRGRVDLKLWNGVKALWAKLLTV